MASHRGRAVRIALAVLALAILGLLAVGSNLERLLNRVEPVPLPEVSAQAREIHDAALVADLHADSLLLGRDLLVRSDVGHVDLPRLQEGGVGLQFFTLVTSTPIGMNIERTDPNLPDALTLAGLARLSPLGWRGPFGRALLQIDHLDELVARSDGALVPVRSVEDLDRLLAMRARDPRHVGVVLGVEGAHAMESDPEKLDALFERGVRMVGLTHFFDNDYAGSAHGIDKGGLSELGRETLARMEELGILVDLAHLSPRATDEVLDLVTKPVVVSHGGVKGTCDNTRNVSDLHVRRIAQNGGVVGIGYWDWAVCGTAPADVAAAVAYVVDLVGPDHVALGSDYDGATTVGFDTARLPALTQALLDEGLGAAEIERVLGGNVLRVLRQTLPAGRSQAGAR